MTIFPSALSRRKANRVPVFAVVGFLVCTAPWDPSIIKNTTSETQSPGSPKLEELSGHLILDGVGLTGDAIRGLVILNLDKAKISDECLAKFLPLKGDADFQKRLCEQCKNPPSTLGTYVLLNTLYPDKRLNLVEGALDRTPEGMTDVPIKILSGDIVLRTAISRAQFGVIVYEYWRHHFGIKSEGTKAATPGASCKRRRETMARRRVDLVPFISRKPRLFSLYFLPQEPGLSPIG